VKEETRVSLVAAGVRWCSNILIELASDHVRVLSEKQREALKDAISALARFRDATPEA